MQFEAFFFGDHPQLFGAFHKPQGVPNNQAVLICPPLFHESQKVHFALKQISVQLSEQGFSVLRFDFAGCGDSFGDPADISVANWETNLATAFGELKRRSLAARINIVAVRFSGALALASRVRYNQLVLWDSVLDGKRYASTVAQANEKLVDSHTRLSKREAKRIKDTELLGVTTPHELLIDIASLKPSGQPCDSSRVVYVSSDFDWETPNLRMINPREVIEEIVDAIS